MQVPPGQLVAGVPAKVKRVLPAEAAAMLAESAHKYRKVARAFLTGRPYRPNQDLDLEL
jgi:carbonic anhydrase/acetyltransferase-like protein (isoleucine patch superfamily)